LKKYVIGVSLYSAVFQLLLESFIMMSDGEIASAMGAIATTIMLCSKSQNDKLP